jgi:hypothetical protein
MVEPRKMAHFFGFTKDEVRVLAEKYGMDFDELVKWYDGYQIGDELSIFNPNSVIMAQWDNCCSNNWWGTSSIHAFDDCISKNYDGIYDEIIKLFDGHHYIINQDHLNHYAWGDVKSKDDVLTAMIHFGYLTYDSASKKCYIPNKEVLDRLSAHINSLVACSSLESTMTSSKRHISVG